MIDIRPWLDKLDGALDPAHAAAADDRQCRACTFQPVDRLPLVIGVGDVPGWPRHEIDRAFYDRDLMLMNELRPIYASALIGDNRANTIRANFGVGIIASLFGCGIRLTHDAMPWVDALGDVDAIRRIVRSGPPDMHGGLWPRIAECQDYFHVRLAEYPNLRRCVRLSMCDMQGPFSIAHEVWGNGIWYAAADEPELVDAFMEVVTETYLRFIEQERVAAGAAEDFTEFISALMPGKVMIREDSAINLSPAMYERFCRPYIQRVLDQWPGGIHYCGAGHQIFGMVAEYRNLLAMNFGNASMQRPELVRSRLVDRGIAVVGWNDWPPADAIASAPTGVSLETSVEALDDGRRLWESFLAGTEHNRARAAIRVNP